MITRSVKTAAIAATMILATTVGAFASTAWADGKVKMKDDPYKSADTIEVLYDGDKVKVLGCFENDHGDDWCKVRHDGEKGFVRLSDLDFHHDWDGDVEFSFGSGGVEIEFQF